MIIKPYTEDLFSRWDEFIDISNNGVFLHKRKFLSYHKDRFIDASVIIENDKGQLIGLFPAAVDSLNKLSIVSHPGITFGGIVSGNRCRGETCIQAVKMICDYYRQRGYKALIYKVVPYIYHKQPYQDDLYTLFRIGAIIYRSDISATINLTARGRVTKGRKYEINKGRKKGVTIQNDIEYSKDIWKILERSLLKKHKVKPVHSLQEILLLHSLFQKEITFLSAIMDDQVVAGLVLFRMGNVLHTQYIAAGNEAYETGALDFLIESAIDLAKEKNFKYYNFGISNESEGQILNEGLYRFKRSFGAGSVVHDYYKLDL